MKYTLLLQFFLLFCQLSFGQNQNIDSISHINYQLLHSANLNDCWGYTDETGIEYALVGTTKGTSIVSLEDPTAPVEILWIPGSESTWRDLQVYNDVLYVTTEAQDGLLIVNLAPLPQSTSLSISYYNGPTGSEWSSAHDIFVDTQAGWAYICGANRGNGGMIILDIHTNPLNPIEVGEFDTWYCHDAFAQGNKLYGAHISDGFFSIIDVTDHSNPVLLNTQLTSNAFTHNIWATSDDHYVVTTDELVNSFLDFYDVSDPMNIQMTDKIQSSPGLNRIPHNAFIKNDYLVYTSYYADGVTIHDMTRPRNVVQIGRYDTNPVANSEFNGCWGVYPFLPSGLILASDMQNGLFVLEPTIVTPAYYEGLVRDASNLAPLNGVKVKIIGNDNQYKTTADGNYYVGVAESNTYEVVFSKVAYHPDTVEVNFLSGFVERDTIDLVPIDPLECTIIVTDYITGDPIIGANTRISNELIDIDQVTDGFGEANLTVYYPGNNKVVVGKWGYRTHCIDTVLENDQITLHYSLKKAYYDDFSFDFGWTTYTGSATHGFWERGIPYPSGNVSVPGADADYDCANYCYLTGNAETLIINEDDVEGGIVTLLSPTFDLTGYSDPYIYFERHFFNYYGPEIFDDKLSVSLQSSAGTILIDETEDSVYYAAWEPVSIRVLDYMPLNNSIQLRVRVSDFETNNNVTEAAFDHFMITEGSVASINEEEYVEWLIVPNPSTGIFSVIGLPEGELYTVLDIAGKSVFEARASGNGETLDLNYLNAGIYTLKCGNRMKKVMIL